jgi:far upstream element-binding protein
MYGTVSQVNAARAAIKVMVENSMASKGGRREPSSGSGGGGGHRNKEPAMAPGTNKLTFTVPDKCVGLIIGRGGESINDIQRKSGSRVNIVHESQSANGRRPVNLFGTDEANERARELIDVIVKQDELGIKKGQGSNAERSVSNFSLKLTPIQHNRSPGQHRGGSFDGYVPLRSF